MVVVSMNGKFIWLKNVARLFAGSGGNFERLFAPVI